MAAPSPSSEPSSPDGPVLSLLNKRLRALRKKYNRVVQMEENVARGKTLNKEQEEVLRSKPQLSALIDEYERLRGPLASALHEELSLRSTPTPPPPPPTDQGNPAADEAVEDVLRLLYFARLFDVRPQAEYETTMLMRAHERGCCITYDTVTDETTSLLEEADLDVISALGAAVLSRPPNSDVSHRAAFAECARHARAWLARSDEPVLPGSPFTYAGLRERLNRIWGSNYSTATPEITDLAAEVGKYVQVAQGGELPEGPPQGADVEAERAEHELKVDDLENLENKETGTNGSSQSEEPTELNTSEAPESYEEAPAQPELDKLHVDDNEERNYREGEPEQQQYVPRRAYTNQRAPRGGGRRPFGNGRGGRGGRGGRAYQNGRNQYYDSGYHPGNFYAPRGRNGRGGGSYNHGGPGNGGHSPGVELGAS